MSFTGNENHSITLTQAAALTKKFRDSAGAGATIAHYIGKKAIQDILNQQNCVGIRIYYALNEDGKKQLVVTGVNSDQNDLYEGLLADRTMDCPLYCSASNPLNTDPTNNSSSGT